MNETYVTLQGWLGAHPSLRRAGDSPVTSFRVASTPRRYQRSTSDWVDGEVQWFTVTAWRTLAEHCARSLRRGDPVVVHGRLTQRSWTDVTGVERTTAEVEAAFVGHDLNRGTTVFSRPARPEQTGMAAGVSSATGEPVAEPGEAAVPAAGTSEAAAPAA